jgi:hypothetical protein
MLPFYVLCYNLSQVLPIFCFSFRIRSQSSFSVRDIFHSGQTSTAVWSAHGSFATTKARSPFLLLPCKLPIEILWKGLIISPLFASWSALPECYRKLMGRQDFNYPKLETNTNGKRFLWKVSFFNASRLDTAGICSYTYTHRHHIYAHLTHTICIQLLTTI